VGSLTDLAVDTSALFAITAVSNAPTFLSLTRSMLYFPVFTWYEASV